MTRIATKILSKMKRLTRNIKNSLSRTTTGQENPKLLQNGIVSGLPPYQEEEGLAILPPYEEFGDPDIQDIESAILPTNEEVMEVAVVAMAIVWMAFCKARAGEIVIFLGPTGPRPQVQAKKVKVEEEKLSFWEKCLDFHDEWAYRLDRVVCGDATEEEAKTKKHFFRRRMWRAVGMRFADDLDTKLFCPGGIFAATR